MRIACVSRSAAPRSGGIEAHLKRVAEGLAAAGHDVHVYAARIDDAPFTRLNTTIGSQRFSPFTRNGVKTLPIPLTGRTRAMMLPAVAGALPGADRLGYDRVRRLTTPFVSHPVAQGFRRELSGAGVVHAWGGEPLMHGVLVAADALGLPFVVTPFAHPGHWGDDELNARLYRDASAVVALLPSEADFYASLGVDRARLHVIPVGAPPEPDAVLDVPHEGRLVVCLGVKRRYKYRALLDAIPHVEGDDVRFAFVGPETPESNEDFVVATDPRIVRVGKVGEPEKWGWLRAANVLCLPSVSEILPVSILEAWRMGTPVVVAEGRFTRDLVADGVDGIVTGRDGRSIAKAIEQALADPSRTIAMGRAGAAKVAERYEPASVVEQHEALYRSLALA